MASDREHTCLVYENCQALYLKYKNDFLTVEKFAEYLELPVYVTKAIIDIGRYYNCDTDNQYGKGFILR